MSNLLRHAETELTAAGYLSTDEEGPNKWMREKVLELVKVFAAQGHSGSSAPFAVSLFEKVARYEPLVPLQGTDDEWSEYASGQFQNMRCSHVFKQADRFGGRAYDVDGLIFVDPNGYAYTGAASHVPITFPYTPKSDYVYVDHEGHPISKFRALMLRLAVK